MTALEILDFYYPENTPLKKILLKHSSQVCSKALEILEKNPQLNLNRNLVTDGAMLHDIGIGQCNAPSIQCFGTEPYLCHGIIGAEMLRKFGKENGLDLEAYARICERHTGTGLTAEDIHTQGLPLPEQDFLPETLEEKLICLADKFYSKSGDMQEKSLEKVRRSMQKFGPETSGRLEEMLLLFHLV